MSFVKKVNPQLYKFYGIVSNNIIDRDNGGMNIITEEAHTKFVEKFNNGELNLPIYLFYWHYPSPVGEVEKVIYYDGYVICSGYFYKEFNFVAEALMHSKKTWGMSHGTFWDNVVFSKKEGEEYVIIEYEPFEFTFLPISQAANPMTVF